MNSKELLTTNSWDIYEVDVADDHIVTTGSNFMVGNGYLGYRGTHEEWEKDKYVGCIVTDTYDNADGKWSELCNVPNGLFTTIMLNGISAIDVESNEKTNVRRLDMKQAILYREAKWKSFSIKTERWASYHDKHIIGMRYTVSAKEDGELIITTGIDGDVWSINGDHFKSHEIEEYHNSCLVRSITQEDNIEINVGVTTEFNCTPKFSDSTITDKKIMKRYIIDVKQNQEIVIEKFMVVYTSNDTNHVKEELLQTIQDCKALGYSSVKSNHVKEWEKLWKEYDIDIVGDDIGQTIMRFNLYHNIISTPTHKRLPIGARGLSCQAYQGAAFWDQEIFNMPMYLFTTPEIAKNILLYRYETLNGARKKAKDLGYQGAFYAWISGKTGEELCPSFFFKDVLTERDIRNHFNIWQIHISPDIAYAVWQYYELTLDDEFMYDYGAEMLFEIAMFLASRSLFNPLKDRYEFIRLLGPDEYHENVDNNVFTNYQAKYAIDKALILFEKYKMADFEKLSKLLEKISITPEIVSLWKDMQRKLYVPVPDKETKLIEQFDGYFELEDIKPDELKKRLKNPSEYWGWPNGIAVHTQVLKQADVIQLFVLHDSFSKEVLKSNYDYYEPRTEHGSSLSPAVHSIIANRIGYKEQAYDYFIKSCTIDLFNKNKSISGGTFIGGIHAASCGAAWQIAVFGFSGLTLQKGKVNLEPSIPDNWDKMSYNLTILSNKANISIRHKAIHISASTSNSSEFEVYIQGKKVRVKPGVIIIREY